MRARRIHRRERRCSPGSIVFEGRPEGERDLMSKVARDERPTRLGLANRVGQPRRWRRAKIRARGTWARRVGRAAVSAAPTTTRHTRVRRPSPRRLNPRRPVAWIRRSRVVRLHRLADGRGRVLARSTRRECFRYSAPASIAMRGHPFATARSLADATVGEQSSRRRADLRRWATAARGVAPARAPPSPRSPPPDRAVSHRTRRRRC